MDAGADARPVDADLGACVPIAAPRPPARHALAVRGRGELAVFVERTGAFRPILREPGIAHFTQVAWGDADGDGVDEVASSWLELGDSGIGGARVFGDHGAGLAFQQELPVSVPDSMTWLNADSDGQDDLWFDVNTTARVKCSNGTTLSDCWSMTAGTNSAYYLARGDADHDGDDDIALQETGTVHVYRNVGGQFSEKATITADVYALAWVELDGCAGDELVMVVSHGNAAPLELRGLRWNGTAFVDFTVPQPADAGLAYSWADVDGDGDADVALCVGPSASPTGALYRRDPTGYVLAATFPACVSSFGDYDGDGDLDVTYGAIDNNTNSLVIARNDNGTFTEAYRLLNIDAGQAAWGRCGPDATHDCFPTTSVIP
ncbi:MAG: hypothetical protein K8W52_34195 [Deltaproteobacteria bacterium]|nr:hypothetical protein [Deltaproteobacteria bacterium]